MSAQDAIALSKDYSRETDKIDSKNNNSENLFERELLEENDEI